MVNYPLIVTKLNNILMSLIIVDNKITNILLVFFTNRVRFMRNLWNHNIRHNKVILVVVIVLVKFKPGFVLRHNLDKRHCHYICEGAERVRYM